MNQNNKDLRLRGNRPAQGHGDKRGRIFLIGMMLVLLGYIPFIRASESVDATNDGKNMAMRDANQGRSAAKPPIDVSTPADTETATFALG